MSNNNALAVKSLFGAITDAATCVVEGRQIPRLMIREREDGQIELILDRRFAIDVPPTLAPQVAWLVANALAIGEGYTHLGAETKDSSFAPKVMTL